MEPFIAMRHLRYLYLNYSQSIRIMTSYALENLRNLGQRSVTRSLTSGGSTSQIRTGLTIIKKDLTLLSMKITRSSYQVLGSSISKRFTVANSCVPFTIALMNRHYGRDIIQLLSQLSIQPTTGSTNPLPAVLSSEKVDMVYEKVYTSFIEHIDGIDNGVGVAETSQPLNYQVSTTLSSRVSYLNASWNDPRCDEVDYVNARFQDAMYLTVTEFIETVLHCIHVWLPARSFVEAAFQERHQIHPSGRILYFPQYCPWKSHLFEVEEAHNTSPAQQILFCVYHESTENTVRVQAVNTGPGAFTLRKGLNESWRGLRGEELSAKSNIPNCIFVHNAGFVGGNKNYEGALAMAVQSLPDV